MTQKQIDPTGYALIMILLTLLLYAGYLSYKSIDWDVLKRLEAQPLVLPTPIPQNDQTNPQPDQD